eukprot:3608190-Rhodomonas_salina.3
MFASPGAASIGDAQAMLAAYHTAWGVQNLSSTATSLSRTITEHGSDAALLHSLSVQESPAQELETYPFITLVSLTRSPAPGRSLHAAQRRSKHMMVFQCCTECAGFRTLDAVPVRDSAW